MRVDSEKLLGAMLSDYGVNELIQAYVLGSPGGTHDIFVCIKGHDNDGDMIQ